MSAPQALMTPGGTMPSPAVTALMSESQTMCGWCLQQVCDAGLAVSLGSAQGQGTPSMLAPQALMNAGGMLPNPAPSLSRPCLI